MVLLLKDELGSYLLLWFDFFFFFQLEDKKDFHEKFIHFLKYAMIIYRREPAVEQVINFVAKFVTSFYQMQKEDGSEEGEEDNLLMNYMFNFLLEVL